MKKAVLIIIATVFVILLFGSPYIIDNVAAARYKNQITDSINEISNITVVASECGLGNVGGTGNHTDMWVCVLIKTDMSEERLTELVVGEIKISKVDSSEYKTDSMTVLGVEFDEVEFDSNTSYYIAEFIERAPCSDFDLRGH